MCFLTGCVILLMGLLHLGFLVEFVSMPVISGFTNAAAIIIGTSQLGTLLGLSGRSDSFVDAISKVVNHFDKITFWDPLLGICSMILLVCLKVRFLFIRFFLNLINHIINSIIHFSCLFSRNNFNFFSSPIM